MYRWYCSIFKVISEELAVKWGLQFVTNVYGDAINKLNCRSIWKDKSGRHYRVEKLYSSCQ